MTESRVGRHDDEGSPTRRSSVLRAVVGAIVAASALSVAIGAVPAAAAAAPTFTITSYSDGQFVSGDRLTVEGTAPAGDSVRVTADGADPCTAIAATGTWRCELTVPDGSVTLTATRTPGSRAETPAPTPSPSAAAVPSTIRITLHVLGAPTLDGADTVSTTVSGRGYPGAVIVLALDGGSGIRETSCATVSTGGTWTCTIDVPSGDYGISARQHVPDRPEQSSPSSPAERVRVDRDPPPAPVITDPADGDRTDRDLVVSGTGEDGDTVSVFVDGSLACSAPVSGGRFACGPIRLTSGSVRLTALERDQLGNYSAPSSPVDVTIVSPVTPAPTPTPAPSAPAPTATPSPTPGGTSPPAPPAGAAPPSGATPSGPGTGWTAATGFGISLPAVTAAFRGPALLSALLAAGLFVALVALPMRLALDAVGPRIRVPRLMGGRRRLASERTPLASVVAMAAGWIVVVLVAAGLHGSLAHLRLVAAVLVGLAVLNAIGVVATGAVAARLSRERQSVRLVPALLLLGAVGALVSSFAGIDPPIVAGVVMSSVLAGRARADLLARIAQLVVLEALAVGAWVAHGAVGAAGLWGIGFREALAAIAISGLSSVALLLLPIGPLPGRAILARSRTAWACCAVVAGALAAIVLGHAIANVLVIGVAIGVAAVCLGVWAWLRFVDPALAERG